MDASFSYEWMFHPREKMEKIFFADDLYAEKSEITLRTQYSSKLLNAINNMRQCAKTVFCGCFRDEDQTIPKKNFDHCIEMDKLQLMQLLNQLEDARLANEAKIPETKRSDFAGRKPTQGKRSFHLKTKHKKRKGLRPKWTELMQSRQNLETTNGVEETVSIDLQLGKMVLNREKTPHSVYNGCSLM
ncbi:Hypothetical predicted protein [Cloeon dipterum]|uniref:Uncharacterized protein n=1 Tax=Cloeon dipterum TaxID=197152 RepID=A0A8S1CC90_9INSE|nr:Hypothetical predicted protein [Cloeon dipterum]